MNLSASANQEDKENAIGADTQSIDPTPLPATLAADLPSRDARQSMSVDVSDQPPVCATPPQLKRGASGKLGEDTFRERLSQFSARNRNDVQNENNMAKWDPSFKFHNNAA